MMVIANVEDARLLARRKLPKVFFEYIDGAAFSEETAHRNISDFSNWTLQQRVLVDVSSRSQKVSYLGKERALPFLLGPVGFSGLFAERGEIQAARAAHAAGIPFCLSSFAITSLEALREATSGPLWFQLYVLKDRGLAQKMIDIAIRTDVEVLCVTVDTPIGGVREKDVRNGFRSLTKVTPKLAFALAQKPGWCARILRHGIPEIGNLAGMPQYGSNALEQATKLGEYIDASMNWDDIAWIRKAWPGKLLLKGILNPLDAAHALNAGADGIVVSNHGGRQLDGAASTIETLPRIVDVVGDKLDVFLDGGIRRGTHVVKALTLGAKAVLLGRAYAYGLAAGGQQGVSTVIHLLRTEIDSTIGQMGLRDLSDIHRRQDELVTRRHGIG
ncbi:alpha-hydroxy acid oxidase [Rhizobium sp. BK602]|uniref:alpha-hydroxy acid oxidase n=1 Tax=Rhizobium sp. BK602 TaxID=2586986 RepID=UPI0017EE1627|nr:alpha-hydroxy acid oxidase [Rhizobium sp. BK602]MBB3610817.1 isopentenyl diphosphate isomerase/L-lactate dehydrogenase-like FMN-dependent dehydrogenase [Rhizobium sp. BK602]